MRGVDQVKGSVKKKILVIDDDESIGGALDEFFDFKGLESRVVDSVESGLSVLHSRWPDLALLDFRMAQGGGLRVLEEMEKTGLRIPVIMISASREIMTRSFPTQVVDRLIKPFSFDDLWKSVNKALL